MKIESQALRDSAKGEACTLQLAGICNRDTATTVLAHLPDESNGLGTKSDDISGCYACSACHDVIDSRAGRESLGEEDFEWHARRAMVRTWRRMIASGVVVIPSLKGRPPGW